jgi:ribonuclease BN (tRNA processing enzyme)
MAELAAGADALLHDCQYTESEYATRRGWGHSTPRQAVRLASAAGVRRLVLFHHDPSHSDEQVEALADEVRKLAGGIEVSIAQEGAVMALTGGRTEPALLEA